MLSNVQLPLDPTYLVDYDDTLGIDGDQAAGDVALFVIPFKCEVMMVAGLVTEVMAGSTSTPIVAFDKRPTGGSDTDRTDATIGNLIFGAAAAGTFKYDKAGLGQILYPGQEVVVQLVTAAVGTATGHFRPVLIVKPVAEEPANIDAMVETT